MRDRNPFSRLAQVVVYATIVQCILGLVLWFFIATEIGVGKRWTAALSDGDFLPPRTGSLQTSVRNVFGDPVGGARLVIRGTEFVSDGNGIVIVDEIPIGLHEVTISAEGYETYTLRIRINEGLNEPLIKYDHGLWPHGFAVDFHAFYEHDSPEEQRVFLQIGLANGSDVPFYIRDFFILDEHNQMIELLTTPDAYRRLALMHTALSLATQPYALIIKPRGIVIIELPPLFTQPKNGMYFTLVVQYGTYDAHRNGTYETIQLGSAVEWEADLSPHKP